MRDNKNISVPQSGMIRDLHPQSLAENQYPFAMNANIEGEDGSVMLRQNEPSNLKCMEFDGYKVVGYKNDVGTNNTYFFLAHPHNHTSKIIFFESNEYARSIEDVEVGDGLDIHRILGEKLEESNEVYDPICGSYKILIEDDETDPCLNFSLAHPVKTIEIKEEKCGKVIYWTDGYNPPRYVDVTKALEPDEDGDLWYSYHGYKICGAKQELDRCKIACEKLRIFPLMDTPCIQASVMAHGGSLRAGIRQYCVALCDQFGNETSNYHSLTDPVHIFDPNDILIKDGKWGARTSMGVRLDVSNLDKQSMYYKIGVIQKTVGFNGEAQPVHEFFIEGIHPITEQTVYHLSDLDMQSTSLVHLSNKRPVYKTSDGITTVGNRLLQYGLSAEPEWNLQPVCNFLGHFLQWQSSVALDTLYKDGVACSKYATYMRDEVYPFSISFLTSEGYETAQFSLIPRPKNKYEAEIVSNKETESIKEYVPNCTGYDRIERWQFYNTAKKTGLDSRVSDGCKNEIDIPRSMIVEKDIFVFEKGGRIIDFSFTPEYFPENILVYLENNPNIICETGNPDDPDIKTICDVINGEDDILPPDFPDECHSVDRVREKDVTTIPRSLIKDFHLDYTMKTPDQMSLMSERDIYAETNPVEADEAVRALFGEDKEGTFVRSFFTDGYEVKSLWDLIKFVLGMGDCGECTKSEYQNKLTAARQRRFRQTPKCTIGCTIKDAMEMPEIWPQNPTFINLSRITGWLEGCSDFTWSGSQTSKGLGEAMDDWRDWAKWSKHGQEHIRNTTNLTFNDFIGGFSGVTGDDNMNYMKDTSPELDLGDIPTEAGECPGFRSNKTLYFFTGQIAKNAKWFKITRPDSWDDKEQDITNRMMYLEIYGSDSVSGDEYDIDSTAAKYFRVSFFDEWGTPIESPLGDGVASSFNSDIFKYGHHKMYIFGDYAFGGRKAIYVAVDSMMCAMATVVGQHDCGRIYWKATTYCTAVLPAELGIGIRKKEVKYINVQCTSLTVRRAAYFQSWCTSCGDTPLNCDPRSYEHGEFGYWESLERYPSNFELYDSTRVRIDTTSGDPKKKEILNKLSEYYGNPGVDSRGYYFIGKGSNYPEANPVFCQLPIRHYKFPDNIVSPFCAGTSLSAESEAYIYPIGIRIDESVISAFLDIAVDSGLISSSQRSLINGYKIYRGDRSLNKSVIGTGIGFDMYKYNDDNAKETLYANYPYNDLGDDIYNYTDGDRFEYIHHPYGGRGNTNFVFHSPDMHFYKPETGTEIRIEGYQSGSVIGEFTNVEDYPKYVLLGPASIAYAKSMARKEALAKVWSDAIMAVMNAAGPNFLGLTNNLSRLMAMGYLGATLMNIGKNYVQLYSRYKHEWLSILLNRGIPDNFANYYASKAYYNSFTPVPSTMAETDTLRGLNLCKYINNGKYSLVDPSGKTGNIIVNNRNREKAVFFSLGKEDYVVNIPSNLRSYDNSRVIDGQSIVRDVISGPVKQRGVQTSFACSPYIKMKVYAPSQYNGIENIKWLSIGYCGKLNGEIEDLFGGDVYISRFSVKRKFSLFSYDAFGLADLLPFAMTDYRNVGFPKYFLDYETKETSETIQDIKFRHADGGVESSTHPYRESLYYLNGLYGEWYLKGRFYTYFYGIPQFLVESDINCNERLMGVEPREGFYPAVGDYMNWTQEKNVSIKEDEEFMISPIYMARSTLSSRMLPATYERKFWDCAYQRPNGVIWSRVDQSENSMTDPWLYYNPLDVHEFPAKFGKLIHLKGIESEIVLGRFENQVSLFNTVDVLKERMPQEVANELGTGGLFAGRSMDYNQTDLGYSGTQSTEMISSEYGHFWVDAKRGQVFMVKPNGEGLQAIHPGMSHWLQEHLPFKILKYGIVNKYTKKPLTYEDVDNKFAGLGISLGWDNRFKRVFVTKKDYMPVFEPSRYSYDGAQMFFDGNPVDMVDPNYFVDVSFTLAYSCKNNEWISYYSFTPDYYIEHLSYFQTGKNFSSDLREEGLWSHLLTAQSYQVFYGKRYPFMIELPVKEQYVNKILTNIQYRMESRRYQNEIDYSVHRMVGFNKAWVYNNRDNSGLMHLIPEEKNNWAQKLRYPRAVGDGTEILATEIEEGWNINDFFNRVKDNQNNVPQWIKDVNDINKEVNGEAVYYNSIWKDRLRGDWFLVRYSNDKESRFKMIFRWQSNEEKLYRQ